MNEYYKNSRWFGLEPPTRRSQSKSAHKCIPFHTTTVCAKFYLDRLRFGSTRAKNLFWSNNRTAKPILGRQQAYPWPTITANKDYCRVVLTRNKNIADKPRDACNGVADHLKTSPPHVLPRRISSFYVKPCTHKERKIRKIVVRYRTMPSLDGGCG